MRAIPPPFLSCWLHVCIWRPFLLNSLPSTHVMSLLVFWSQVSVTIVISILRSFIAFPSRSSFSVFFFYLMLTVAILSWLTCSFFWLWVWICLGFLTFTPCCLLLLLLLFWLGFFLCHILFWISNSLIFLIVPYGNPNRLTSFGKFLRPISCVLLYIINMISYTRLLSINYNTTGRYQEDNTRR